MLKDLEKYIADARKKGFSFDDIALRLESSGWNPSLVEHEIKRQKFQEDNKAVNSSIWYVVGIFVAVVVIVYAAAMIGYGPSAEVFCVKPGVFGLVKVTSYPECCSYIAAGCQTGDTFTLKNNQGKVIFASNNHCKTTIGDVIVRGDIILRC